jgi:predicted RNA-binding Zn-ribbon protein involved in translation (DUF1610 family)
MNPQIRIFELPAGTIICESGIGREVTRLTHQCNNLKNKSRLCAGEVPCRIHAPAREGEAFRARCSIGFYVRFVPVWECLDCGEMSVVTLPEESDGLYTAYKCFSCGWSGVKSS